MPDRQILLLTNEKSRNGRAAHSRIRDQLGECGLTIMNAENFEPSKFCDAISQYHNDIQAVVIGGGDGSMNAALPALLKYKLPLGVIPMGTSNNLSRNLNIPLTLEEACAVIQNGHLKTIDLGCVNGHYFFNVAGMGISIEVNKTVPSLFKKYFGMLAYIFTALKVFRKYQRFHATIETSAGNIQLRSIQITVCNGKFFGSGMEIDPNANMDDGMLNLCSVHVKHWHQIPRVVANLKKGVLAQENAVYLKQDRKFSIQTSRVISVDADGEIKTQTPAKIEVVSNALSVFVPPSGG